MYYLTLGNIQLLDECFSVFDKLNEKVLDKFQLKRDIFHLCRF